MEGIELMGQHGREDYESLITVGIWAAAILALAVLTGVLALVL